jgi:hypothetical protein
MSDPSGNGKKQLGVYAIIERKDATKPPYWLKIGLAFANRDGSLSLYVDAFPVATNKLQVREIRPFDENRGARGAAPDPEAHP